MFTSKFIALAIFANSCFAASGSFEALTYNVAGLPEGLSSSEPEANTPFISTRLTPYDLINVQEDFNFHADLYASDNHPFRTATSGGVPVGSGLNTLSNFPFIDFVRTTWDKCFINDGDCLTPKGFTSMRVQLDSNHWLDVYNLHTDAGGETGDLDARASNIAQVLTYMETYSAGMPVLLMGDTNMRYTTINDSAHILLGGFDEDAWVTTWRGSTPPEEDGVPLTCPFPFALDITDQSVLEACEVVDKILLRSAETLTMTPTTFTNENLRFINPDNNDTLSDHYPQHATVSWEDSPSGLLLSDIIGGPHGDFYNDVPAVAGGAKITTLTIAGGARVDSITAEYDSIDSIKHGGTGGTPSSLTLEDGETVVSFFGCQAQHDGDTRVFYLNFTTSEGRGLEAGVQTDDCLTLEAPGKGYAVGFWGRSGDELDRMGVVWGSL